jgi:hypothetical protein
MNFIGIVGNAGVSFSSFVFNEDRMADELRKQFGGKFDALLEQHHFLSVIWRECLDTDMMLWILRLTPYRQSYYDELSEFVRSLFDEQISSDERLGHVDTVLARQKFVLLEDNAKRTDRDEIVAYQLWEMVWELASYWWIPATHKNALKKAIWGGDYPDSDEERVAYRNASYDSLMQEQAKRLRELIRNPFLPNMAAVNQMSRD